MSETPIKNRELLLGIVLFALAVLVAGVLGNLKTRPWHSLEEASALAEDFLQQQGARLSDYDLVSAAKYRLNGTLKEPQIAVNPSIYFQFRYLHRTEQQSWNLWISPMGQLYRVSREYDADDPGAKLPHDKAVKLVQEKLVSDLHLPSTEFKLLEDTLLNRLQRYDYQFEFTSSKEKLKLLLTGEAISKLDLTALSADTSSATAPPVPVKPNRIFGFGVILIGVFVGILVHKNPLGKIAAAEWGVAILLLMILAKALTFPQQMIMIAAGSELNGFMVRLGLSAMIQGLQVALVVGLVIAAAEALAQDYLPRISTLGKVGHKLSSWQNAVADGARVALPIASVLLIFEVIIAKHWHPVGLAESGLPLLAGTLSSPFPQAALPVLTITEVLWKEIIFRLGLISLVLFFIRPPILGVLISAVIAAFFSGYNFTVLFTSAGSIFIFAYALLFGWIFVKHGVWAILWLHLLILGVYCSLFLFWTGAELIAPLIFLLIIFTALFLLYKLTRTPAPL